ncbi:hypothetical protein KL944_001623 [Ogataea haglerorum]|nr:hypothetical protein KL944_001623 [Ogataea haglerorum]
MGRDGSSRDAQHGAADGGAQGRHQDRPAAPLEVRDEQDEVDEKGEQGEQKRGQGPQKHGEQKLRGAGEAWVEQQQRQRHLDQEAENPKLVALELAEIDRLREGHGEQCYELKQKRQQQQTGLNNDQLSLERCFQHVIGA